MKHTRPNLRVEEVKTEETIIEAKQMICAPDYGRECESK